MGCRELHPAPHQNDKLIAGGSVEGELCWRTVAAAVTGLEANRGAAPRSDIAVPIFIGDNDRTACLVVQTTPHIGDALVAGEVEVECPARYGRIH